MKHALKLLPLAALLVAPVAAPALVFTVTATADSTAYGFTSGQSYTFNYWLNDFAPTAPEGHASGSYYFWYDESVSVDPQLWADMTGSGLVGPYTRPSSSDWSPYSFIRADNNSSQLALYAGVDSSMSDTGLTSGGVNIGTVSFSVDLPGVSFDADGVTLPDPTTYFSGYMGSYAITSSNSAYVWGDSGPLNFTPTQVVIGVPEPSSYAALFGALTLGFVFWRRMRG